MTTPRILYLDAYDSFSNNIISLLQKEIQASIESIKIDDPRFVLNDDAFLHFLEGFDAVVAGPGPGHPGKASDIGLIARLWSLPQDHIIPVLGICLGFQSLCLAYGASVERLREPRHGLVTPITHCDQGLFEGTGKVLATQYHSLHVRLEHDGSEGKLWRTTQACKDMLPLAWDLSDSANSPIVMAARHAHKPFWGVQYHPESICTNTEGRKLIRQWWRDVRTWKDLSARSEVNDLLERESRDRVDSGRTSEDVPSDKVQWQSIPTPRGVDVANLLEALQGDCESQKPLLLESGTRNGAPVNPETGRFSVIGVHDATSTHVRYFTSTHKLTVTKGVETVLDHKATISDVFDYLEHLTSERKAIAGPEEVPFWGGLVGFVSYEAGLESLDVEPAGVSAEHPDVWFVFVEKSVVVDHINNTLYVQSLADNSWVDLTVAKLKKLSAASISPISPHEPAELVGGPIADEYCARVRACQEQLRAGESYELCLTDTTRVHTEEDPWSLYRRLRHLNPAPFGAYLSLPSTKSDLSIASSSPERFLSWSRDGHCQFRPIKGTVKKAPGVTRRTAEEILRSPKEQAENLMIVDLIRHDLSGVKGVTDVYVPKLMSIEEYATVYQLVSVITGSASNPMSVLAASLPPGSMTGAPKKRSCELLRSIEGASHVRGIYSGVIGYLDVGGGGDFSVAIRTAFKWGDENCWRIGAGGAVTVLSEAEAEWEEMIAKRESALRAFGL